MHSKQALISGVQCKKCSGAVLQVSYSTVSANSIIDRFDETVDAFPAMCDVVLLNPSMVKQA